MSLNSFKSEAFVMAATAVDDGADGAVVQAKLPGCFALRLVDQAGLVAEDLSRHLDRIYQAGELSVFEVHRVRCPLKVLNSVIRLVARNVIDLAVAKGIRQKGFSNEPVHSVSGLLAVAAEVDLRVAVAVQAGLQNPFLVQTEATAIAAHQPSKAQNLAFSRNLVKADPTDNVFPEFHSLNVGHSRVRTKLMIKGASKWP